MNMYLFTIIGDSHMLVVLDIDGTLADITRRLNKAGKAPLKATKQAFQSWLDKLQPETELLKDKPIKCMQDLVTSLSKTFTIVYLTGRSEKYKDVTIQWLSKYNFPKGDLYMRPRNDFTATNIYKREQMYKIIKELKDTKVIVFDDDPEDICGPEYKKHGWTHLKAMANYKD